MFNDSDGDGRPWRPWRQILNYLMALISIHVLLNDEPGFHIDINMNININAPRNVYHHAQWQM